MSDNKRRRSQKGENTGRPLISACMIVRDEEENLERCLASVRQAVDEIVVVDTGSRDRTVEIARRHGCRVSHFQWCDDFAAARNAALEQARGQWILQMDADEELQQADSLALRRLVTRAQPQCWGFLLPVRSYQLRDGFRIHSVIQRLLLFRNHPDLRYRGRIHESIHCLNSVSVPEFQFCGEVSIDHYGYLPDQMILKNKEQRNLQLLQMAVAENPREPLCLFNLGREHYTIGQYAEATDELQKAVDLAPAQAEYLPDAYSMLVLALSRVGRGGDVLPVVALAEQRLPRLTADVYNNAGQALLEAGNLDAALVYFQKAIDTGSDRTAIAYDPGAHTWLPRLGIGAIYEMRGCLELALASYQAALEFVPTHPLLNCRLARVTASLGQPALALEHVNRALQTEPVAEDICQELLQVCRDLAADFSGALRSEGQDYRVLGGS